MKEKTNQRLRASVVEDVRRRLLRHGMPRVLMSLILLLTGAAGFLCSYLLLHAGVGMMAVRYPLAVLVAYAFFLLMLRLWIAIMRRGGIDWGFDPIGSGVPDVPVPHTVGGKIIENSSFGGGDFDGGGAGGSWDAGAAGGVIRAEVSATTPRAGGSGGGSFDFDFDDAGAVVAVIALVATLLAACLAVFYVIYIAPLLLAEVAVDALLVGSLYRSVKHADQKHWLASVVRRTCVPVLLVVVLFVASGYLMQRAAPEAKSIGGVWAHVAAEK